MRMKVVLAYVGLAVFWVVIAGFVLPDLSGWGDDVPTDPGEGGMDWTVAGMGAGGGRVDSRDDGAGVSGRDEPAARGHGGERADGDGADDDRDGDSGAGGREADAEDDDEGEDGEKDDERDDDQEREEESKGSRKHGKGGKWR